MQSVFTTFWNLNFKKSALWMIIHIFSTIYTELKVKNLCATVADQDRLMSLKSYMRISWRQFVNQINLQMHHQFHTIIKILKQILLRTNHQNLTIIKLQISDLCCIIVNNVKILIEIIIVLSVRIKSFKLKLKCILIWTKTTRHMIKSWWMLLQTVLQTSLWSQKIRYLF